MTSLTIKTIITIISLIAMMTGYKVMQSNLVLRNCSVHSLDELANVRQSEIPESFILTDFASGTMTSGVLQSGKEKNSIRLIYDTKAGSLKFIIVGQQTPDFLNKLSASGSSYFTHETITENAKATMQRKGFRTGPGTMVLRKHAVPLSMFSSFVITISGLFAGALCLISLIPSKTRAIPLNRPANNLPLIKRREEESVNH